MKKAVIYARVSSERQRKKKTIASQIAILKRQVGDNDDILVKEYIDDGYSGAKLDRPGLEQLRKDVKDDTFDVVYFLNTDRIAREVTYQTIIIGEILKQDKQIIINGQDYVHNPENKFTLTVLGAVAELERAKILERYSRGRLHKIRKGILMSHGHLTFGYNYIPRNGSTPPHFEINEQEAETVRYIYTAFAKGASKASIVRHLEDSNILTKTGKNIWRWKTVQNILKNSSYAGIKYFNTRTMVKESTDPIRKLKYGKEVFKDKSEWIPVRVPVIISEGLFEKVQTRFKEDSKKYMSPQETQLLSGLVKCGECGGSYTGYKRFVRGYRYDKGDKGVLTGKIYHRVAYVCSNKVRQKVHSKNTEMKRCSNAQIATHRLESIVFSAIENTMTDKDKLRKHCIGLKEYASVQKMESQIDKLGDCVEKSTIQKQTFLEHYAKGKIDRDEYSKKCIECDNKMIEAKKKKSELLSNTPTFHKKQVIEVSIDQYCEAGRVQFEKANDFESQRKFCLDYIEKVVFVDNQVELHGSVPVKLKEHANTDTEASKIPFCIKSCPAGRIKRIRANSLV